MSEADIIVAVIAIAMVVHLAIGLPLFVVLGLGSLAMIEFTGVYSISVAGEVPFSALDNWALLAMPLFILTGDIISTGRIARQLVDLGQAFIGWIKGGLGMATVFGCFFFAGTSGSASADTVAIGRIMIPAMVDQGYNRAYAAALAASGGCLGIIVPPSLILIIYGVVTSTSVGDLFLAGILPGLVMAIALCMANYIVCLRRGWGLQYTTRFSALSLLRATWNARYGLGAPAVILGGIYTGLFTPTEAAAVAVAYCLIAEMLLTRAMSWRAAPRLLIRSGIITGMIAPIIAFSVLFGEVLAIHRIPDRIVAFFLALPTGTVGTVLVITFVLVLVGCFLEPIAAIIIMMPMLLPVGVALEFDPVHFGIFVVCALSTSFITPPVGINLFAASAVSDVPFMNIAARALPLFAGLMGAILVIAAVPWLALWFR